MLKPPGTPYLMVLLVLIFDDLVILGYRLRILLEFNTLCLFFTPGLFFLGGEINLCRLPLLIQRGASGCCCGDAVVKTK